MMGAAVQQIAASVEDYGHMINTVAAESNEMHGRVESLEKSALSSTAYRMNKTMKEINLRLDNGDIEGIEHDVFVLLSERRAYKNMNGNGDFDATFDRLTAKIIDKVPVLKPFINEKLSEIKSAV